MSEKIIAVDFDGCLVTNKYPEIGEEIWQVREALVMEQIWHGTKVILWTCRIGELLTAVVGWCADHGLRLDAVNENLPEIIKTFGGDTRKIFANEYWDDRAVRMPEEPR
jgi:hypothetical protein